VSEHEAEETVHDDSPAALLARRLRLLSVDIGVPPAELAQMWLAETTERFAAAATALAAGDLAEVERIVHSAAGTSGICGASGLSASLTSVERLAAAGRAREVQEGLASALTAFTAIASALKGTVPR
jgi:HPt (histidine-containing phosphotransfer) domain-containing protein